MPLSVEVFRSIEPSAEGAVLLCADEVLFPLAYMNCAKLAALSGGAYDVYLMTEPSGLLARVPPKLPFGILFSNFQEMLPKDGINLNHTRFGYARLFALDLVPRGYKRILYLDSDIRIDGPVAPLFALPMAGKSIAAADALGLMLQMIKGDQAEAGRQERIGISSNTGYFNSGMLLIDVESWARADVVENGIALIRKFGRHLTGADQDILNVLFGRSWLAVSPRWNFSPYMFGFGFEAIVRPAVYHYLGRHKPWLADHWFGKDEHVTAIQKDLSETPFGDFGFRPPLPTLRSVIRRFRRRAKRAFQEGFPFLPPVRRELAVKREKLEEKQQEREARRRLLARYLIENVQNRRFADVEAGITRIDIAAVQELMAEPSP